MRSVLVDWLVDVHLKAKLHTETLFLAVNILDRYLCKAEVTREDLQLSGICALLVRTVIVSRHRHQVLMWNIDRSQI